ncbi:MAG: polymer-forming cytoskeletal protein [bacterium]
MLGKKSFEGFNASGELNTIIGKGSTFEGTLKVQSTLRVDGKVKGKITTSDSLVVGKEGDINGEVAVKNAIVGGKLRGKLQASGKVVFEANSVFNGELKTSKLVIDEGAIFEGVCSMSDGKIAENKSQLPKSVPSFVDQKQEPKEIKIAKQVE